MSIITRYDLNELHQFLIKNRIKGVHNCQLLDLQAYIEAGGITSRNLAEKNGLNLTPFSSDQTDKDHGVNHLVFGNFQDFGELFHKNQNQFFPNCYGPISLEFDFSALEYAQDFSVTLRSASGSGFVREVEGLSLEEIKGFFRFGYLKNYSQISQMFSRKIGNPEISIRFEDEKLPLMYLNTIWVDPVQVKGRRLVKIVQELCVSNGLLGVKIKERNSANYGLYQKLVKISAMGETDLFSDQSIAILGRQTNDWLSFVKRLPPHIHSNFLRYLKHGTLDQFGETSEVGEAV